MIDGILSTLSALMDPSSPWIYLIAFTGGLLSSFLPCSLSSLPLVIGYVSGGRRDTRSAFRLSLVFAIGMAVTYTVLATVALALGSLIGSTSRIWYMILAVLTLLMALQLSGLFTIIPASNLQTRNTKRGYFGALVAGLLSGVFRTGCGTAFRSVLIPVLHTRARRTALDSKRQRFRLDIGVSAVMLFGRLQHPVCCRRHVCGLRDEALLVIGLRQGWESRIHHPCHCAADAVVLPVLSGILRCISHRAGNIAASWTYSSTIPGGVSCMNSGRVS